MADEQQPDSSSSTASDERLIDKDRRDFLLKTTGAIGGVGAACALTPFISSWLPSAKAQAAGAPVQVDLKDLEPGQQVTVEWRGKPVWILRRTKEMLKGLPKLDASLRDPKSLVDQQPEYAKNEHRSINPEYLVLVGICTHLGCVPKFSPNVEEFGPDWLGGFYCPCHGSRFDFAGRVFKGVPAPINLQVPPYKFVSEHVIVIGESSQEA